MSLLDIDILLGYIFPEVPVVYWGLYIIDNFKWFTSYVWICGPWKMTRECLFYENMYLAIIRAEHE